MSMRRAVIINYQLFLVHMMEVENLILSSAQVYLLSLPKSPITSKSKEHKINK